MGCQCSRDVRENTRQYNEGAGANKKDLYRIGRVLGTGAFGQVRECMHKESKQILAMKIMEKTSEKGHWSNESMFRREVDVLGMLNHPYIVRYHAFFEDSKYLYAVMEKCDGGELFESILKLGAYSEKKAIVLCYQMLTGLAYLHSIGIVHRDIKAENYLFTSSHPDSAIKLIDFGMSAKISKGEMLTDICGSPHYLSPELIRRRYSFKADVWAVGVLVYLMIYGRYPFDGNNTSAIVKMILTKKVEWQTNSIKPSTNVISFMKLLLQRNPEKRPTAVEATQHIWFASTRDSPQRELLLPESPTLKTSDDLKNVDAMDKRSNFFYSDRAGGTDFEETSVSSEDDGREENLTQAACLESSAISLSPASA